MPNTDRELPKRIKLRRDSDEPTVKKSNTDSEEPKRDMP